MDIYIRLLKEGGEKELLGELELLSQKGIATQQHVYSILFNLQRCLTHSHWYLLLSAVSVPDDMCLGVCSGTDQQQSDRPSASD